MIEFDSIMSVLHEGVELYSLENGCLLDLNDQACKMFGVEREKILKSGLFISDNPNFPIKLKRAFMQKKHVRIRFSYHFTKVRKNNYHESKYQEEIIYLQCSGSPFIDQKDGLEKYILVLEDITPFYKYYNRMKLDLKKKDKDLKIAREMANRSDKLKAAFISNMTHEIRTPLNAIVGFSDLIRETTSPEERDEYTQIIWKNTEQLTLLVNNMLDLSKIEAGYVEPDCDEEVDISDLFKNIESAVRVHFNNPEVQLLFDHPYESCLVYLNRKCAMQVTNNLIDNALKYTREGYIKVGYQYSNKSICFYVEDTGIGISNEKLELIFNKFEKVNDFVQGAGLGLALCREIVRNAGGKIEVNSKKGKGSTFRAWLPCKPILVKQKKETEQKTLVRV